MFTKIPFIRARLTRVQKPKNMQHCDWPTITSVAEPVRSFRLVWLPLFLVTAFFAHVEFTESGSAITLNAAQSAQAQETTAAEIEAAITEITEFVQRKDIAAKEKIQRAQEVHDKILAAPSIRAQPQFLNLTCELDLLMRDLTKVSNFSVLEKEAAALGYINHCLEHAEEAGSPTAPWLPVLRAHVELAQSTKITDNENRLKAEKHALETMFYMLQTELPPQMAEDVINLAMAYSATQFHRVGESTMFAPPPLSSDDIVGLRVQGRHAILGVLNALRNAVSESTTMPDKQKQMFFVMIYQYLSTVDVVKDASALETELKGLATAVNGFRVNLAMNSIDTADAPDWSKQKSQLTDLILNTLLAVREMDDGQNAKYLESAMAKVRDL